MRRNAHILLVDDDPHVRRATSRLLGKAGYEIIEAATGAEGLRLAKAQKPDLILLDVVLPDVDGVEVCRRIKGEPSLAGSFVTLISNAKTLPDDRAGGLEAGADGYIARPISNRELLARVNALLRIKRVEEELRESEERFRTLFDNIGDPVFIHDGNDGRVLHASQTALRRYGYSEEEVTRLKPQDFDTPEYAPRVPERIQRLRREKHLLFETLHRTKDGHVFPVEVHSRLVQFKGETVLLTVCRDITERVRIEAIRAQAEEALRESERRLIAAQRIARMGDFTWDVETGEVTWSDGLFDLLGYDTSDRIDYARVNAEIHHPDDLKRVTQWLNNCIASGDAELTPNEYRLIRKDGEIITIRAVGIIEREDGGSAKVFATVQDITELHRAREEARRTLHFLEFAIEQIPIPVIIAEAPDVAISYFNRGAVNLLTKVPGDVKEIPLDAHREFWPTFYPDGTPYRVEDLPLTRAIQRGDVTHGAEIIVRREDGDHWISASAAPLRDEEGRIIAGIVAFPEITERKRAEADIVRASEALREHREHLEELVAERTADLRKMVNAMAGREVRMAELKGVIRELRAQLEEAGLEPVANDPLLGS